ncbi:hypothetical protein [Alloacidobacterium sp.]|uniref:hypothetical protein n=1 Tax=Alloacidobacterium sp. TaxID=2951999 RepID=UPI002D2FBC37|nr:hypothetical protein [Alloacidobacterium sp.]HYK34800.1 hypothetical protein [Alloacidobacterium sp.]
MGMIKRSRVMYVPWDADALADALFDTEDLVQARILAKALAIKVVDDTQSDKLEAKYLKENQVEALAQEKTLAEALMQQWMRPLLEAAREGEPSDISPRYLEC